MQGVAESPRLPQVPVVDAVRAQEGPAVPVDNPRLFRDRPQVHPYQGISKEQQALVASGPQDISRPFVVVPYVFRQGAEGSEISFATNKTGEVVVVEDQEGVDKQDLARKAWGLRKQPDGSYAMQFGNQPEPMWPVDPKDLQSGIIVIPLNEDTTIGITQGDNEGELLVCQVKTKPDAPQSVSVSESSAPAENFIPTPVPTPVPAPEPSYYPKPQPETGLPVQTQPKAPDARSQPVPAWKRTVMGAIALGGALTGSPADTGGPDAAIAPPVATTITTQAPKPPADTPQITEMSWNRPEPGKMVDAAPPAEKTPVDESLQCPEKVEMTVKDGDNLAKLHIDANGFKKYASDTEPGVVDEKKIYPDILCTIAMAENREQLRKSDAKLAEALDNYDKHVAFTGPLTAMTLRDIIEVVNKPLWFEEASRQLLLTYANDVWHVAKWPKDAGKKNDLNAAGLRMAGLDR